MRTSWLLGPPGALETLPAPLPEIERPLSRPQVEQVGSAGGVTVDRIGRGRRRYRLAWRGLTLDEAAIVERLWALPGALILDDPNRRNRLTANQSSGGDAGLTAEGVSARLQGTVSRSTAQARLGTSSLAWATGSALAATARGVVLASSLSAIDDTWHPVIGLSTYTFSVYARATAALSAQVVLEWFDATGASLGGSAVGAGTALGTANWNTRLTVTGTAPATAAYGIGVVLNTSTTGAAVTMYLDNPQIEENPAATAWVIGSGIARVASAAELEHTSPLAGWESPALPLIEL